MNVKFYAIETKQCISLYFYFELSNRKIFQLIYKLQGFAVQALELSSNHLILALSIE
jgi:hypothetical protein